MELRLRVEIRAHALQLADSPVDLSGSARGPREENQGLQVLRLLLQHLLRGGAPVLLLAGQEVDRAESERDVGVVRLELLGLHEEAERLIDLTYLVVRERELADRLRIVGVDPQRIPVLDHRLAVLLLLEVSIAALQVARLLGLRRPA